ncbi:MAG: hypothetical protein IH987_03360 [Planctomycetes bacterium]|nr:hypothetical protein [Planctomycetota bacterium]
MPKKHDGVDDSARGSSGGKPLGTFRCPLVCLGACISLLGAANGEPVIVTIGVLFVTTVLGLPFQPPGRWSKWLK